jgi:hypothetical protein
MASNPESCSVSGQLGVTPVRSGGLPELAVYGALDLSFQRGFGLWHSSDEGRSFRLPSSGSGRWWLLSTGRRFSQNSNMARATRSAFSMIWIAPMRAVHLREAPGMVGLARRQHRCGNRVGRRVRVCIRGCCKPESRVPIYKPGTFLLVREMDSNKPPHRIRG